MLRSYLGLSRSEPRQLAIDCGTAFQLTNILRDLAKMPLVDGSTCRKRTWTDSGTPPTSCEMESRTPPIVHSCS